MKIKRFLSTLTALMLTASASPLLTNADFTGCYLEEAVDYLGEDTVKFEIQASNNVFTDKYTAVMTEEKIYYLLQINPKHINVNVKKNTELPLDEINSKFQNDYIIDGNLYTGCYSVRPRLVSGETEYISETDVLDILIQYEDVIKVSRDFYVGIYEGNWTLNGIKVNSDLSKKEIVEKYSELELVDSELIDEEYTYVFNFGSLNITKNNYAELCSDSSDFNFYEIIKKLSQDTEIDSWTFNGNCIHLTEENVTHQFSNSQGEIVYIAEITGDTNVDGDINISDVLTVSAHINNKDKYPMEEQSAINGDVHETGNGLNSSDAFMIQQYVTGVIESL